MPALSSEEWKRERRAIRPSTLVIILAVCVAHAAVTPQKIAFSLAFFHVYCLLSLLYKWGIFHSTKVSQILEEYAGEQ